MVGYIFQVRCQSFQPLTGVRIGSLRCMRDQVVGWRGNMDDVQAWGGHLLRLAGFPINVSFTELGPLLVGL